MSPLDTSPYYESPKYNTSCAACGQRWVSGHDCGTGAQQNWQVEDRRGLPTGGVPNE